MRLFISTIVFALACFLSEVASSRLKRPGSPLSKDVTKVAKAEEAQVAKVAKARRMGGLLLGLPEDLIRTELGPFIIFDVANVMQTSSAA